MTKSIHHLSGVLVVFFALLLSVFSSTSVAGNSVKKTDSEVAKISPEELLANRGDYFVLDVRTLGEFAIGHIEGAANISHRDIADQIDKLKGISKPIVVHCRSGKRAAEAEATLLQNGITNLRHLEGDMIGWKEKELPLVRGTSQPEGF